MYVSVSVASMTFNRLPDAPTASSAAERARFVADAKLPRNPCTARTIASCITPRASASSSLPSAPFGRPITVFRPPRRPLSLSLSHAPSRAPVLPRATTATTGRRATTTSRGRTNEPTNQRTTRSRGADARSIPPVGVSRARVVARARDAGDGRWDAFSSRDPSRIGRSRSMASGSTTTDRAERFRPAIAARGARTPRPSRRRTSAVRARERIEKNVFERDASKRERRGAIRDARGRFRGDDDAQVGRRAGLGELEQSDGRVRARDAIRARCER